MCWGRFPHISVQIYRIVNRLIRTQRMTDWKRIASMKTFVYDINTVILFGPMAVLWSFMSREQVGMTQKWRCKSGQSVNCAQHPNKVQTSPASYYVAGKKWKLTLHPPSEDPQFAACATALVSVVKGCKWGLFESFTLADWWSLSPVRLFRCTDYLR